MNSTDTDIIDKINLLERFLVWFYPNQFKFKQGREIDLQLYQYPHFASGFVIDYFRKYFFRWDNQRILRKRMDNAGIIFLKTVAYVVGGVFTCGVGFVLWPCKSNRQTGSYWTFLKYGTLFATKEKEFINNMGKEIKGISSYLNDEEEEDSLLYCYIF